VNGVDYMDAIKWMKDAKYCLFVVEVELAVARKPELPDPTLGDDTHLSQSVVDALKRAVQRPQFFPWGR
jgi:hypothetical protein